MNKQVIWPLACCLLLGITHCPADELTFEEFERLHAQLVPKDETWKSIPWETNLLTAQQLAAKQEKPIFIWAMDGHPLGCT